MRDEAEDDVEAMVSGENGHVRLVVLDHVLNLVGFVESDVGWVGDDEIKAGVAGDVGENVTASKVHVGTETLGVEASYFKGRRRQIDGVDFSVGKFAGEGDGYGSGAGADVDEFEAGDGWGRVRANGWRSGSSAGRKMVDQVKDCLDEVLGFRAWNEHGGGDEEFGAPELLVSGEVLQGLTGGAAVDELIVGRLLGGGQLTLGMGVEVGAVTAEGVKHEHFGADARLVNSGCFELGDGRLEGLAELHGFIVRRGGTHPRSQEKRRSRRPKSMGEFGGV